MLKIQARLALGALEFSKVEINFKALKIRRVREIQAGAFMCSVICELVIPMLNLRTT